MGQMLQGPGLRLLASLTLSAALLPAVPVSSAQQGSTATPPSPAARTVLERIRQLLGLTPPIAIGGSRSGSSAAVCLISPRPRSGPDQAVTAHVSLLAPTILAAAPLNEVRIERDGRILWRQAAPASEAIRGEIRWPLAPLTPGETVVLKLRPLGVPGGAFAVVSLTAAPGPEAARHQALMASLGQDPAAWLRAIREQAERGNRDLAMGLLFAPTAPQAAPLRDLREAISAQGCR